jgi:hypothetical protein
MRSHPPVSAPQQARTVYVPASARSAPTSATAPHTDMTSFGHNPVMGPSLIGGAIIQCRRAKAQGLLAAIGPAQGQLAPRNPGRCQRGD